MDRGDQVRKLTPMCSATLVLRVRHVDPMYSDTLLCVQLNLYTRLEHMGFGILFLKEKKDPVVNLLDKTILMSKWIKKLSKRTLNFFFISSD